MSRLRGEERGGILVLSAILIPVFIVLTAMVVDVGQWYTHKRQLQTRADAGAFAAGIDYADNWKACVYSGSDANLLAAKTAAARAIANRARQYAADTEVTDYAPDPLPATLYNQNIANQPKLDVVINSTTYTDDTDYTDGGGSPPAGDPCLNHAGDSISPAGGQWVDVRVKENDLPSIFGSIGVPLRRNVARARVEIRPAKSGNKFLPLAVPNNVITKVQVRYYNECNNPPTQIGNELNLVPLGPGEQGAFVGSGGGTLWGLEGATPGEGDSDAFFQLTLPTYSSCQQPYLPVGMEVRLASTDSVDLNQSCAALIAAKFADCFHRLSQIRVWDDGVAPLVRDVELTPGCGVGDAYFGPLPVAANPPECRFGASVDVFWGTMDDDELAVSSNFHVTVNGVNAQPPGPTTPSGRWTVSNLTASPGANDVSVQISWTDTTTGPVPHIWDAPGGGACRNGGQNPCRYNGPVEAVHRTYVGTNATAGAVALAGSYTDGIVGGLLGSPYDTVADGGNTVNIHPTVGIKSVLRTGVLTTIRLDDPQANQSLRCDPNFAQGQEFSAFRFGCQPWYGKNTFTNGPWWNTGTKTCPERDLFFSYNTMPIYGLNSKQNAWQCVPTAPGFSVGQVGDNIGVATKNCGNINNNSCQGAMQCNWDGNYDGTPTEPNGWLQGFPNQPEGYPRGSRYPRVVNLFVIPYQSLKGSTGGDPRETVPILTFASFFVFNWTAQNNQQSDPCPDRDFDHDQNSNTAPIPVPDPPRGAMTGVFVETVDYESGPVDETAVCVEGQLEPCRASLVR